jgi:hypothetical protein
MWHRPATRRRSATAPPLPTTDVNRTPLRVVADGDGNVDLTEIPPGVPIVIEVPSGCLAGTLNGEPADLHFDNVTITGGDIVAVRLIVDSYLELGKEQRSNHQTVNSSNFEMV